MTKSARHRIVGGIGCEPLTEEETKVFQTGTCPDCRGSLREGPHGGLSVNYICNRCGRTFNDTRVFGVDRIVEEPEVRQ